MARRFMLVDEAQENITAPFIFTGIQSAVIGVDKTSASTAGFYGAAPVAIRATNVVHNVSNVSASSYMSVTSNLAAFAAEVAATLVGLGIWQ